MEAGSKRWVLFDWGGTLMSEDGPVDVPMALWPEVSAIEGAVETVIALAGRYRIGVATNASVSPRNLIELALGRVGLREHVDDVFCYTDIGARKDEDAFWRAVLERCRAEPSDMVMIGDSYEQDVLGPRSFGLHAILFARDGGGEAGARTPVVTRLPDAIALVDQLFSGMPS